MRHRFIAAAAATALIIGSSCALAFTAPSTSLDGVPSGKYMIDNSHTNVLFGLSHMGFSQYYGRFNVITGTLEFDAKAPEKSKLDVKIDIASIDTNSAELEKKLVGADWFDAAKFPSATFVSTKVEKTSATKGKVTGDLTIHGVTKPVVLDVTFNGAGQNPIAAVPQLGFSATTKIKRSDFGVAQYVPMVGDEVTLTIESELQLPADTKPEKK